MTQQITGSRLRTAGGTEGRALCQGRQVNDSELVQKKPVIPFQVTQAISPIDVKIHYQLYSATGYVYVDPAMEISTIQ